MTKVTGVLGQRVRWAAGLATATALAGGVTPLKAAPPRALLLSWSSYKENVGYPRVYFYRHDGLGQGKLQGSIPPGQERSDVQARLSGDGRLCFYNYEFVGKAAKLAAWDLAANQEVSLRIPAADSVEMTPSPSNDGKWLAFSSLRRGNGVGWNLFVLNLETGTLRETPGLNSDEDDRMPCLSGDGSLLAYAASRPDSVGLQDVYLYDLRSGKHVPLPGLNTTSRETEPYLSADGRLIAFVSSRPADPKGVPGTGDLNIYLYDRASARLVELPGLNGPGSEQSPALTPDGRYVSFVSERISGAGGRDLYLYDREPQSGTPRLVPLPDLNSFRDEVDPSITYAPGL